ncbi:MAG: hypothetical protein ACM3JD_16185 [Rudaea sp.]
MEPTSWDYFAPYQPDIQEALHKVQERVFARGEYEDASQELTMAGAGASARPRSVEELRERCGDRGTHSILDIRGVAPHPESRAVSPLPRHKLDELFGTDKPELEAFENDLKAASEEGTELFGEMEDWRGIYLILYQHGKPDQIFFHGSSGG